MMGFFWQAGGILLIGEAIAGIFAIMQIGFFETFGLYVLGAIVGGWLVRRQGLSALRQILSGERADGPALFDNACLLLAGLLFMFPGFISDALALCLLVPRLRGMTRRLASRFFRFDAAAAPRGADDVIEGRYEVVEEKPPALDARHRP